MSVKGIIIQKSIDESGDSTFKVLVRTDRYDYCRIPVATEEDARELASHIVRLRKGDVDRA